MAIPREFSSKNAASTTEASRQGLPAQPAQVPGAGYYLPAEEKELPEEETAEEGYYRQTPARPPARSTRVPANRRTVPVNAPATRKAVPGGAGNRAGSRITPPAENAVSRAATRVVRGASYPLVRPASPRASVYPADRRDPFLHLLGAAGLAALLGGGFLTISAFGGHLAGWIAATTLTVVQTYCRREAREYGWNLLYGLGFLFTTLFSSYFNLIGLLSFHGYGFDFRPLAGVLWKSTGKVAEPVELYVLVIYFFVAVAIDVLAEPLCMSWFEKVLGGRSW